MHCGTVNVAGLANYLHVPDLQACEFFVAFAFHWCYFCTFFLGGGNKNLSLPSAAS